MPSASYLGRADALVIAGGVTAWLRALAHIHNSQGELVCENLSRGECRRGQQPRLIPTPHVRHISSRERRLLQDWVYRSPWELAHSTSPPYIWTSRRGSSYGPPEPRPR